VTRFKAIIMRLLGLHPHWEVRRVNMALKKDLPGTRLFHGNKYREALKAYKAAEKKLGVDEKLKLQAVCVTKQHWVFSPRQVPENDVMVHRGVVPPDSTGYPTSIPEAPEVIEEQKLANEAARREVDGDDPELEEYKTGIEESDYLVTKDANDAPGHDCNFAGEMVMIEGRYTATCSICGEPQ